MDWRSMESAPKDGTAILVWDGKLVEHVAWRWITTRKDIGCWDIQGNGDSVAWGDYSEARDCQLDAAAPTHWMPLPKPPA